MVEEVIENTKVKTILRSDWELFSLKKDRLSEKEYFSKQLNRYISNRWKVEYCINSDNKLETSWPLLQKIYRFRDECNMNNASTELLKIIEN